MAVKRINLTYLLESGKRLNPVDLIIHYRYRILTDKKITVSVWGTSNNKGYLCLGHQDLFRPTDFRDPLTYTKDFNTDIFQLKAATATGLFIFIDNAEYVEIKKIDFCFNEASKLTGREMECSPYYPPYPEVGYNVNPFVLLQIPTVDQFMVNPLVFTSFTAYGVNPFVMTETISYAVNPMIMVETTVFTVNPLAMVEFEAYSVNPLAFAEYELYAVNPFVLHEDNPINIFYLAHELTTAPVMPEGCIFYFAEYLPVQPPTITKVDNTIVMT